MGLSDSIQHLADGLIGFGFLIAAGIAAASIAMSLLTITKLFK